jgi:TMEM175 potassium channel family protein
MKTDRLLALSDGVFAIALTLLVLELPIPKHSMHLASDLAHRWPFYAAYAVSFLTIAIAWINHHSLMAGVAQLDRGLIELNLVLLFFVAAVPWPTGVLALYLQAGGQGAAASLTYGLVMTLLASSFTAVWVRLARAQELSHPEMRRILRRRLRRSVAGPVAYGTGTLISLASAPIAFALYAFVPLFFAFSGRTASGVPRSPSHTRPPAPDPHLPHPRTPHPTLPSPSERDANASLDGKQLKPATSRVDPGFLS